MRWSSFEGGMLAILYTWDPTYELDLFGAFDRARGAFDQTFRGVEGEGNKPQDLHTTNRIPETQAMLAMIKLAPHPDHKFPPNHAWPQFGYHFVLSGQRQGVLKLVFFSHARAGHSSLLPPPITLDSATTV
jgi:hypothetical protein